MAVYDCAAIVLGHAFSLSKVKQEQGPFVQNELLEDCIHVSYVLCKYVL